MTVSTKPLSNRIAIVFDFDDTLVPDTVDALLESLGIDALEFRQEKIRPLIDKGWDKILARFYALIEESKRQDNKITQEYIASFGQELAPFDGVNKMFDRLQQCAHESNSKVEVEFYLITCGMLEIARHNCIAPNFKAMWGCEFSYGDRNGIEFLKKIVTHTEKTRYLFQIAKGFDDYQDDGKAFVYRDLPPEELHIPLSQVIYVGDGASDIPCFSLMNQEQGTAIALYKDSTPEEWGQDLKMTQSQRVANLAPVDYSENSELMQSLTLVVEGLCKRIALQQLSVNE
ncbi:haloacid dehalogenase-like hydrolase [Nostoc sp. 'Peltigera membranacea cyanobiont' 210A]|uniref:HAD family hydrolase n=1 Tax=Nostoc sp. 'Peltigera membranacea cyanobiont' 210A TaxID=2014529 RepID=UPI000B9528A8|nr:HAD hydrolase-like protein [Nostoc sp. 'Peltigera membranacea cyanobiont' 210A]OYD91534.1 haloacid dehalogenase-like hydrolase [Nostoc sp. 'Peltigera membranacea cyanobiont' 210A]